MGAEDNIQYAFINKIVLGILTLCLTIIGFFLAGVYNKISQLNVNVTQLKVQLTKMQVKQQNFVTYIEMREYIDNKITNKKGI